MTRTPTSASAAIPTATGPSPTTASTDATAGPALLDALEQRQQAALEQRALDDGPVRGRERPVEPAEVGDGRRQLVGLEARHVGEVAPGVVHRVVAHRGDHLVVGLGGDDRGHPDEVAVAAPVDAGPDQRGVVEPVLLVGVGRVERPDDVDRLALGLAAPPDEPVGLVRLQQPRVADVQPDPLERRDRQGRPRGRVTSTCSSLPVRSRRPGSSRDVRSRRSAAGPRRYLMWLGDVLLDPEPDEARVVRVGEDRPADRLGEELVSRNKAAARRASRRSSASPSAATSAIWSGAARLVSPLLDELDVPVERRRSGDLAAERVVGEAVEEARRERGADRPSTRTSTRGRAPDARPSRKRRIARRGPPPTRPPTAGRC